MMKDGGRSVLRVGLGPRVGVRGFAAWAREELVERSVGLLVDGYVECRERAGQLLEGAGARTGAGSRQTPCCGRTAHSAAVR